MLSPSRGYTILIDGYNVIKRHAPWHALPLEAGRARLAALAGRIRWPFPAARVILVFDSRDPEPGAAGHGAGAVRIQFASPSADAYIQDAIRSARDPARVLVVTDDGDILRTAKSHGAASRSGAWLLERAEPRAGGRSGEATTRRPGLPAAEARRITDELAKRWLKT